MCHAHNEKWERRNNKKYSSIKSGKYQNAWRERKLQYLGILEAKRIKQAEMKEIIRKECLKRTKNFQKPSSTVTISLKR